MNIRAKRAANNTVFARSGEYAGATHPSPRCAVSDDRWPYFPIFLKLAGEPVLVVGGGEVALRKVRLLRRAEARIRLVARELHADLVALGLSAEAAAFDPRQLEGCRLAIAATDDAALNARVAQAARERNIPVNVVDDEAASTWVSAAIVDRAPVLVAISSGGGAPVLARRLREKIEGLLPAGYGALASFLAGLRERLKGVPVERRRIATERFLDGVGAQRLLAGDEAAAGRTLEQLLEGGASPGEVYLVGAGPGDPDLLTFRALRLMQQADVVLYDRLVSAGILERVRRDATRIFVGKGPKQHEMSQQEINALLVRLAREGQRVLRLKGGDPFIFGRGGEEIETLAAQGIAFQVVPGITAANGCAAYAGIPLTHRDYAQSVTFVTGHARQDGKLSLDWPSLARPGQTVVFYMGRSSLPDLCGQLVAHGLPREWPAALIEEGTSRHQRVVTGTLATLPGEVDRAGIAGASLVIVGEVVKLRERLQWFEGANRHDNADPQS
jgi:uroporphyrin-III C-methyltransferase / precorrin-2 dehydrogenase / sirohydrochlorin ferrochelatase